MGAKNIPPWQTYVPGRELSALDAFVDAMPSSGPIQAFDVRQVERLVPVLELAIARAMQLFEGGYRIELCRRVRRAFDHPQSLVLSPELVVGASTPYMAEVSEVSLLSVRLYRGGHEDMGPGQVVALAALKCVDGVLTALSGLVSARRSNAQGEYADRSRRAVVRRAQSLTLSALEWAGVLARASGDVGEVTEIAFEAGRLAELMEQKTLSSQHGSANRRRPSAARSELLH